MEFDKPEHKEICLKLIEAASFPGNILDIATEFKNAVQSAAVKSDKAKSTR